MEKLTWMRDLRFWGQGKWLGSFLCCALLATRRGERNILGITDETLDALPQFQSRFIRVKAEADYFSVICVCVIESKEDGLCQLGLIEDFVGDCATSASLF